MSRVRSFFLREATECLEAIRAELAREAPDPARTHAAARLLRGSAQMARYGALARQAGALESKLKPVVRGEHPWSAESVAVARGQLAVLERAVEGVRSGRTEPDPRMEEGSMEEQHVEGDRVVPVEDLEYRGEAALARALELRPALEDAIVADEPVGPILEELFDLIGLGMR